MRDTARLDAEPVPPRAPSHRQSPPARAADAASSPEVCLPTFEQIAAEVRRRPIGAVIVDIRRDLGVTPSPPLWPEVRDLIIRYCGNLANLAMDLIDRAFERSGLLLATRLACASVRSPRPSSTGPPP